MLIKITIISETLFPHSTFRVSRNRIIISKDRTVDVLCRRMTNEDIRRRRAIILYVPWPKLRILDTENTMWSDPSKAVVPFAIQISERRRRRRRTRMPPQTRRTVVVGSRDHDETFPLLRQSAIHRVSFFSSFAPRFPFRYPLVIDLISSFCLG